MPAAFFTVRSTVADPEKRAAFDKWYQNDFWPDVPRVRETSLLAQEFGA